MAKVADKYFVIDQWKIIENGYNPEYGEVAESIFSLGNEYMGIRGFFEEGYSGKKLIGSYFNGIYEQTEPDYGHYKGIVDFTEYMVNSVNWLYTRMEVDGEQLDLATASIEDFRRVLDLKTGLLTRSFVWNTKSGKFSFHDRSRVCCTENHSRDTSRKRYHPNYQRTGLFGKASDDRRKSLELRKRKCFLQ